jgi:MFS family permease
MPLSWRVGTMQRVDAIRSVAAEPALRRLLLAWGGSYSGDAIAAVAFGLLAYRAAGAGGIAVLVAVQMLPAAVLAPVLARWGERHDRERFVVAVDAARGLLAAGAAALAAAGVSHAGLLALAAMLTVATVASSPSRRSLPPLLVRSPAELTAAGVVASVVQATAQTAGPLLAGVVLTFEGPAVVLGVAAVCFLFAAATEVGLPSTAHVASRPLTASPARPLRAVREALEVVGRDVNLRLTTCLFAAKNLGRGSLNVLLVVVPLVLLGLPSAGIGWLSAAIGVGGISGGIVATLLVGRRRLVVAMAAGLALWGLPLLAFAGRTQLGFALAALVIVGIGNTVTDVAGYTLIGRSARDDVIGRVYALHEAVRALAICAGAGIAALLVSTASVTWAVVATGAFLALAAGGGWLGGRREQALELPPGVLQLLRSNPLFAWLPPLGLERLASVVAPVEIRRGEVLLREGDPGDSAYLLAEGELVAERGGREIGRIQPGEVVGEIALLHDAPRMASVRALAECRLLRIDRDEFLTAATGNVTARNAADRLVGSRLLEARLGPDGDEARAAQAAAAPASRA